MELILRATRTSNCSMRLILPNVAMPSSVIGRSSAGRGGTGDRLRDDRRCDARGGAGSVLIVMAGREKDNGGRKRG